MTRVFFAYEPPFRAPRGGPIIDLQIGLAEAGNFPLSIDGVFANQTASALKLWQAKAGLQATGIADDVSWLGVTHTSMPSLFRRCLALTAAFEGQGYTLAIGNFDGAGLTWGIVGFTLVTGDLAKVLKIINARAPQIMTTAFGAQLPELMNILDAKKADKVAWADKISTGPKKAGLRTDWRDAFEELGNQPVARAVQDEVAHDDYWRIAARDLATYGKMTELDAAIFFDTAVQSGGVDDAKGQAITAELDALGPDAGHRERLLAIANGVTADVNPKYADDVRSRRIAIASGSGSVHGAEYKTSGWALDLFPITQNDLA
jgi:peptidoglycan hydrolase-like protein with peptidoglycan-binding domain